jgi:cell division protein FtsB
MSIKSVVARILAWIAGQHPGAALEALSQSATADYDKAVNAAHALRIAAEQEIAKLAEKELEMVEALIEAAARRAKSLIASGTVPDALAPRIAAFQAPPVNPNA